MKSRFKKSFRRIKRKVATAVAKKPDYRFHSYKNYKIKPDPFPRVLFTRMKYGMERVLTTGFLNNSVENTFNLNALYDPDATGVGQTVKGYSNMKALYDSYIIMGAKFYVSFSNPPNDGWRVGYSLNQDTTTVSKSVQQLLAMSKTYMHGLNNTGSQRYAFKGYVKPWANQRRCLDKRQYLSDTDNWGSLAGNTAPSNNLYLRVFATQDQSATAVGSIDVAVKIIYYVRFFNRKELVQESF